MSRLSFAELLAIHRAVAAPPLGSLTLGTVPDGGDPRPVRSVVLHLAEDVGDDRDLVPVSRGFLVKLVSLLAEPADPCRDDAPPPVAPPLPPR